MVETSPPFINTSSNNMLFKVICNVRAEYAGNPMDTTIEWTRISNNTINEPIQSHECTPKNPNCINATSHEHHSVNNSEERYGAGEFHYQNILHIAENGTIGVIIYRCNATSLNITISSDTTVLLNNSSKSFQFNYHFFP